MKRLIRRNELRNSFSLSFFWLDPILSQFLPNFFDDFFFCGDLSSFVESSLRISARINRIDLAFRFLSSIHLHITLLLQSISTKSFVLQFFSYGDGFELLCSGKKPKSRTTLSECEHPHQIDCGSNGHAIVSSNIQKKRGVLSFFSSSYALIFLPLSNWITDREREREILLFHLALWAVT